MAKLTDKENRAMELLVSGHSLQSIAVAMEVEYATLRQHIRRARIKLGARTTWHAAALYKEKQLRPMPTARPEVVFGSYFGVPIK